MAARLYATGAVKSKKAACEAMGLHPAYLGMLLNNGNEGVNKILSETDTMIADRSIQMSAVLDALSRRAIGKIAKLMDVASSEKVQLDAAKDLADRGPETMKVQRHQIDGGLSIRSQDAAALAAALVQAADVQQRYVEAAQGDFVKLVKAIPGEVQNGDEPDAGKEAGELSEAASSAQADEVGTGSTKA